MPDLTQHFGELIAGLTRVADTSDSSGKLMNALRVLQGTGVGVAPAASIPPEAAVIKHVKDLHLAGQLDQKLLLDIGNALGGIIPRPGKYEIDVGWFESVINYHKYLDSRVPFPTHASGGGAFTPMQNLQETPKSPGAPPETRIALVGDWGVDPTYPVAARVTVNIARHQPHYTIHLGDTYYSGLLNEEQANVLGVAPSGTNLWPTNTISFALNSNHEMYAGGDGYFNGLLKDPRFAAQNGLSYFAMQNQYWLIIGLDTAYFARWSSRLYQKGTLAEPRDTDGTTQRDWLLQLLRNPQHQGKRVILLTHHDGLNIAPGDGSITLNPLWTEMTGCLRGQMDPSRSGELVDGHDWWWYWGHVHAPIVYQRIFFADNSSASPRCAGHGSIPYLPFPRNYQELGDGTIGIKWAETELANADDGTDKGRAPNGYVLLTLTGRSIVEEFYDETGRLRWSSVQ